MKTYRVWFDDGTDTKIEAENILRGMLRGAQRTGHFTKEIIAIDEVLHTDFIDKLTEFRAK